MITPSRMTALETLAMTLREVRVLLARPGNAFSISARQDAADAVGQLDSALAQIERGELPRGLQLRALFAADGPIRELAATSGWAEELAAIAARFDTAIARAYGEPE